MNVKETIEDIAYKYKLLTRSVSVNHFKVYSANPRRLDLGKETLLSALLQNVKNGEVVYDIGANVGIYSLAIAYYQPTAKVFAFEPNPETYAKLSANLKLNKISDSTVKTLQVALGNVNGVSDFMLSSQHARSSFYQFNAAYGDAQVKKVIKVDVRTLDSFIDLPFPNHIKIDAEGSESIILEGALEILHKQNPTLYIEPHGEKEETKICSILKIANYDIEKNKGCYIAYPAKKKITVLR
jgi:FkbM family methyltransferase